jgi:hypothetical protein
MIQKSPNNVNVLAAPPRWAHKLQAGRFGPAGAAARIHE